MDSDIFLTNEQLEIYNKLQIELPVQNSGILVSFYPWHGLDVLSLYNAKNCNVSHGGLRVTKNCEIDTTSLSDVGFKAVYKTAKYLGLKLAKF
jgi:hypothetical protein